MASTTDTGMSTDKINTKPFVDDAACQTVSSPRSSVKTTSCQTRNVGFIATKKHLKIEQVGSTRPLDKSSTHRAVVFGAKRL